MTQSNSKQYDAIVIGAGHNGLAAAITLANAGKSVLVLEQADGPGGMATNSEIGPGITAPKIAHLISNLGQEEIRSLDLGSHGYALARENLSTVVLGGGTSPVLLKDGQASTLDGGTLAESEAYAKLHSRMARFATNLAALMRKPPPRLAGGDWREAASLAGLALGIRRMGKEDTREFLRVLLSNAYDTILDEMEDGPVAAAMGFDAILGGHVGPRAPGTILGMMYRLANGGRKSLPKGGMGAVMTAFEKSAHAKGVDIRYGAAAARIHVEADSVTGVELADGSFVQSSSVLSSLAPLTTMSLTGIENFDAEMTRRVRNIRAKGCTAKLNLALSDCPAFTGVPDALHAERIIVAPSLAGLERAYNHAKYGELPSNPILEITLPSLSDPGLTNGKGHVLSAVIQYVPYALKAGWNDETRTELARIVIARLEELAPGTTSTVQAQEILTPADIENLTGAPGGHWHHGEMIADQMLMLRPAPGIERYCLPVEGLMLCGASAHPGGDITGVPGSNAARLSLLPKIRRNAA